MKETLYRKHFVGSLKDAIQSIRKSWDFNPVTRRKESVKHYRRYDKFRKNDYG